MVVLHFSIH